MAKLCASTSTSRASRAESTVQKFILVHPVFIAKLVHIWGGMPRRRLPLRLRKRVPTNNLNPRGSPTRKGIWDEHFPQTSSSTLSTLKCRAVSCRHVVLLFRSKMRRLASVVNAAVLLSLSRIQGFLRSSPGSRKTLCRRLEFR